MYEAHVDARVRSGSKERVDDVHVTEVHCPCERGPTATVVEGIDLGVARAQVTNLIDAAEGRCGVQARARPTREELVVHGRLPPGCRLEQRRRAERLLVHVDPGREEQVHESPVTAPRRPRQAELDAPSTLCRVEAEPEQASRNGEMTAVDCSVQQVSPLTWQQALPLHEAPAPYIVERSA